MGSISFDDLYNNFKIVEPEVKRSVISSSNSGSQNLAFLSCHSSTNDVNTANVHVSTGSTPVSTASTNNNLEQIHEDDLNEIDLKWQLALLSMKSRKFYQRTGKKIIINGSDIAGYDKKRGFSTPPYFWLRCLDSPGFKTVMVKGTIFKYVDSLIVCQKTIWLSMHHGFAIEPLDISRENRPTGMTEAKDSKVCKITRADGSSIFHGDIQALLRRLDRQDLNNCLNEADDILAGTQQYW
ncbi:hypothetical protein Tco_1321272 [Tanacetum coccineum]